MDMSLHPLVFVITGTGNKETGQNLIFMANTALRKTYLGLTDDKYRKTFGLENIILAKMFRGFPHPLQANTKLLSNIRPQQLTSTCSSSRFTVQVIIRRYTIRATRRQRR
jgi:hypothetical protein